MNRLSLSGMSLSAMSFAGFGMLPIVGAGIASAERMWDADNTCARLADDVAGLERSGSSEVQRRSERLAA